MTNKRRDKNRPIGVGWSNVFRNYGKDQKVQEEPKIYHAYIDEKNQRFVIEDREGVIIAIRPMPHQQSPNPGKDKLMQEFNNSVAWSLIQNLIDAANKGK